MKPRRIPRPLLASVQTILGAKLRLEHRVCDATFYVAQHSRTLGHWELIAAAVKRVAAELETDVRAACGPLQRNWEWTWRQRRVLANQILNAPHDEELFRHRVRERGFEMIYDVKFDVNERHIEFLSNLVHNDLRNYAHKWMMYCAKKGNNCSKCDEKIVEKPAYTCRQVGLAVFGDWKGLDGA